MNYLPRRAEGIVKYLRRYTRKANKKYEVSYRNTSAVFFNRFYRPKVIFRTSIAIVSTVLAILRCSCISALTCCAVASD